MSRFLSRLNRLYDGPGEVSGRGTQPAPSRRTSVFLEALETLQLLSGVMTVVEPTAVLAPSLTNFGPPSSLPPHSLSPSVPLFNPALGQLVGVEISGSAQITSQIGSENVSTTSPTTISAFTQGQYAVDGPGGVALQGSVNAATGQPGQQPSFAASTFDGVVDYAGTSGHTFNPLTASSTISTTITNPSQLAAFIASGNQTSFAFTMSASATSGAQAVDGNLESQVATSASSALTVTYEYQPPPVNVTVARYGIHHQPTTLVLTMSGSINAAEAANPANYVISSRGTNGQFGSKGSHVIPIASVSYDPTTQMTTVHPVQSFNFHKDFQLTVKAPVFNNSNGQDFVTVFGGKMSLAGFTNHQGQFVAVQNGHIVG